MRKKSLGKYLDPSMLVLDPIEIVWALEKL